MFLEHGQKVSSIQSICLTQLQHLEPRGVCGSDSIGGLPGMILTTADVQALTLQANDDNQQKKKYQKNAKNNGNEADVSLEQDTSPKQSFKSSSTDGIELIGPIGTKAFVKSLSHFMRRERFPIHVSEGPGVHIQQKDNTSASKSQHSGKHSNKKDSRSKSSNAIDLTVESFDFGSDQHSRKRPRESESPIDKETQQYPIKSCLSYLITTAPIIGKFLPQRAMALGVPKGPLFGKLKAGQSVTFDHPETGRETTVESSQCVEPTSPGVAILILCHADSKEEEEERNMLERSPALQSLITRVTSGNTTNKGKQKQTNNVQLELIIHLAPEEDSVKAFVEEFQNNYDALKAVEHVFLATAISDDSPNPHRGEGTPYRSAAVGAVARSHLCKQIYLTPNHVETKDSLNEPNGAFERYRIGHTLMEYCFLPRAKKGFLKAQSSDTNEFTEGRVLAEESGACDLARQILSGVPPIAETSKASGELFFAGTGSALPCKYRNVTGMYIKATNGNIMLLDVGEGTIGQILRYHPSSNNNHGYLANTLNQIKAAWISHPHADHHLGILRLLRDRPSSEPILLVAPRPIFSFLEEYGALDPSIRGKYIAVDCFDVLADELRRNPPNGTPEKVLSFLNQEFGFTGIQTVTVDHCAYAFAVILEGTPFGRLVYSGDCRPSHRLADIASKGGSSPVDILIHEATFENGMEAEAMIKRHSTVGEALSIGRRMKATNTVLTHFSQRYPKIPPIHINEIDSSDTNQDPGTTCSADDQEVIFAFDSMCLTPQNLKTAASLTPALRRLYPEQTKGTDGDKASVEDEGIGSASNHNEIATAILAAPGAFARSNIL